MDSTPTPHGVSGIVAISEVINPTPTLPPRGRGWGGVVRPGEEQPAVHLQEIPRWLLPD